MFFLGNLRSSTDRQQNSDACYNERYEADAVYPSEVCEEDRHLFTCRTLATSSPKVTVRERWVASRQSVSCVDRL